MTAPTTVRSARLLRWVLFVPGALAVLLLAAYAVSALWLRPGMRDFVCASRLKTLGLAFAAYANDNDGRLPPAMGQVTALLEVTRRYRLGHDYAGSDLRLFHCPCDRHPRELLVIENAEPDGERSSRCSYDCLLPYPPLRSHAPAGEPLMWDLDGGDPHSPRANHRHGARSWGNVLYTGGHVRRVPAGEWPKPNCPPRQPTESRTNHNK